MRFITVYNEYENKWLTVDTEERIVLAQDISPSPVHVTTLKAEKEFSRTVDSIRHRVERRATQRKEKEGTYGFQHRGLHVD